MSDKAGIASILNSLLKKVYFILVSSIYYVQ